jgi:hypothetical protein
VVCTADGPCSCLLLSEKKEPVLNCSHAMVGKTQPLDTANIEIKIKDGGNFKPTIARLDNNHIPNIREVDINIICIGIKYYH